MGRGNLRSNRQHTTSRFLLAYPEEMHTVPWTPCVETHTPTTFTRGNACTACPYARGIPSAPHALVLHIVVSSSQADQVQPPHHPFPKPNPQEKCVLPGRRPWPRRRCSSSCSSYLLRSSTASSCPRPAPRPTNRKERRRSA